MALDFEENIILENNYIRLIPLQGKHLAELVPIALKHPDLLKYSPSLFGDEKNLQYYIQDAIDSRLNKERYAFVIFDKNLDSYIGSTSYGNVSNHHKRLEIGWTWLDRSAQGKGINKQCKFLLLQYAFENLGFERIELKTDSRNLQSRRAIEKIGATFEGELRSHTLMLDGHRRTTVYYSILKDEWPTLKFELFKDLI
ncbi:GNAT family N-acetyltransferase [Bacteroidota bacterium]